MGHPEDGGFVQPPNGKSEPWSFGARSIEQPPCVVLQIHVKLPKCQEQHEGNEQQPMVNSGRKPGQLKAFTLPAINLDAHKRVVEE